MRNQIPASGEPSHPSKNHLINFVAELVQRNWRNNHRKGCHECSLPNRTINQLDTAEKSRLKPQSKAIIYIRLIDSTKTSQRHQESQTTYGLVDKAILLGCHVANWSHWWWSGCSGTQWPVGKAFSGWLLKWAWSCRSGLVWRLSRLSRSSRGLYHYWKSRHFQYTIGDMTVIMTPSFTMTTVY